MTLTGKHKAALITCAIFSTLFFVLSIIKLGLNDTTNNAELLYELESLEEDIIEKQKKDISNNNKETSKSISNKAISKTDIEKEQNEDLNPDKSDFESEPDKDFLNTIQIPEPIDFLEFDNVEDVVQNKNTLFEEINHFIIAKQTPSSPEYSSLHYKLENRTLKQYKTPVYQCITSGMVILNIIVNQNGQVINIDVDKTKSSDNECLIEASIKYGSQVQFSKSEKVIQSGTITFYFNQRQ